MFLPDSTPLPVARSSAAASQGHMRLHQGAAAGVWKGQRVLCQRLPRRLRKDRGQVLGSVGHSPLRLRHAGAASWPRRLA